MRYELDFNTTFEKTLLFWIERFIRNKLTTLSNRQVNDKQKLAAIIQSLVKGTKSIEIFQKLGDAYFFESDYVKAVKWYSELFKMTTNLESEYFERYAYSLRALGNTAKAEEIKILLKQSLLNKNGM